MAVLPPGWWPAACAPCTRPRLPQPLICPGRPTSRGRERAQAPGPQGELHCSAPCSLLSQAQQRGHQGADSGPPAGERGHEIQGEPARAKHRGGACGQAARDWSSAEASPVHASWGLRDSSVGSSRAISRHRHTHVLHSKRHRRRPAPGLTVTHTRAQREPKRVTRCAWDA